MREKGKMRKEKKILIRVNKDEKRMAEELSHQEGKNTSEFFRELLRQHNEQKMLNIHVSIVEKYEGMLSKYRKLLEEYRQK
jgi:mevalonate pyrophosphate decarboxylase